MTSALRVPFPTATANIVPRMYLQPNANLRRKYKEHGALSYVVIFHDDPACNQVERRGPLGGYIGTEAFFFGPAAVMEWLTATLGDIALARVTGRTASDAERARQILVAELAKYSILSAEGARKALADVAAAGDDKHRGEEGQ